MAGEFKKQFIYLGENIKKCITFTVPIQKEVTRTDKNGEDSARFMASLLSYLANNLSQGIHRIKCKYRHGDKNVKLVKLNISMATVFLNTKILKTI